MFWNNLVHTIAKGCFYLQYSKTEGLLQDRKVAAVKKLILRKKLSFPVRMRLRTVHKLSKLRVFFFAGPFTMTQLLAIPYFL